MIVYLKWIYTLDIPYIVFALISVLLFVRTYILFDCLSVCEQRFCNKFYKNLYNKDPEKYFIGILPSGRKRS